MATNHRPVSMYHSLIAATVGAGLALATANVLHTVHTPQTVDQSPVAAITATLQEDDPGWDCLTMGNFICGDPEHAVAEQAWDAWDRTQGWKRLRAATTETRVEYVGFATRSPKVSALDMVAVPGKGSWWYVFKAVPTHPATGPNHHLPA